MEKRRADLIADQLEEMIFTGAFQDGDRLDEIRLSAHFGVSRTPLRESFQRLAVSGLVDQIPRRGVFVRKPGPVDLVQMFEVMAEMEAASARFAAVRITAEGLAKLHDVNATCEAAAAASDLDAYFEANDLFHKTLYRQAGNGYLEGDCLRLHRRLKPFRRLQLKRRGRLPQSVEEHHALLSALNEGDGPGAAQIMRHHLTIHGDKFHYLVANLPKAAE
ncbi:MAG: GntR family transcriptional regulator [Pseudomonadota bacterium]